MVDSVAVVPPGWRALDASSNIVSGAKLKFFDAGTSTPKTVYSDKDLSVSLGSIVYCDSGGYPVTAQGGSTKCKIYVGSAAYKLQITDSSDVDVVAAQDNVRGALDTSGFLSSSELGQAAVTVVSGATADIGTPSTLRIDISGTTTITSFGSGANKLRFVRFQGALTLTHNATSLILPTSANITTAAGDTAVFASDASGNWRCLDYQRTDGSALNAFADTRLPASLPVGQCRLAKSGSNLVLSPFDGNRLRINGVVETIPDAGVSLAPTSLAADTTYYIYAYMSGSTMTLEASTTAPTSGTGTGVKIKTGDATRTLVGMARTITGPAWEDSATKRYVRSWFNDPGVYLTDSFSTDRTTTSTSYAELNSEIRNEFLAWADEIVRLSADGRCSNSASNSNTTSIGVDGTTAQDTSAFKFANAGAGVAIHFSLAANIQLSEGYHYATLLGLVSAGTGTWNGSVCFLRALLKR